MYGNYNTNILKMRHLKKKIVYLGQAIFLCVCKGTRYSEHFQIAYLSNSTQ